MAKQLIKISGMTLDEISREYGVPTQTLYKRFDKIREKKKITLRDIIKESDNIDYGVGPRIELSDLKTSKLEDELWK